MRQSIRYQCTIDLKKMRELYGMTRQEVAEKVWCDARTIVRAERENATINAELANKLAEIYQFDFSDNFFRVDKSLLDAVKNWGQPLRKVCDRQDIIDTEYYCLE